MCLSIDTGGSFQKPGFTPYKQGQEQQHSQTQAWLASSITYDAHEQRQKLQQSRQLKQQQQPIQWEPVIIPAVDDEHATLLTEQLMQPPPPHQQQPPLLEQPQTYTVPVPSLQQRPRLKGREVPSPAELAGAPHVPSLQALPNRPRQLQAPEKHTREAPATMATGNTEEGLVRQAAQLSPGLGRLHDLKGSDARGAQAHAEAPKY